MSFQTLDIEDSGQLVFDFIELETESQQSDFVDWLTSLSTSLKQTYYQAQVEKLRKTKSDAHKSVKKVMSQVAYASEANYFAVYNSQRINTFDKFCNSLKQANRRHLVNNLDMTTLSLPLEYSIINNYWFI